MVGDVQGNVSRIVEAGRRAASEAGGADLIVFPELALTGYPPRDLLLQRGFCEAVREAAIRLARELHPRSTVVLGSPWKPPANREGEPAPDAWDDDGRITNSLLVLARGRITHRYDKQLLPTYDVFDEDRYFRAGSAAVMIDVAGVRIGLSICEDLWKGADIGAGDRYKERTDPVEAMVTAGARVIVNPSASPFVLGKSDRQREILASHARRHGIAVAAVNQVGGNDDLIFDGQAAVYLPGATKSDPARLIASGRRFEEAIVTVDIPSDPSAWPAVPTVPEEPIEREALLWDALVLGVRDYCRKTGFVSCVLGLSGGIDSALTAALAAAALGPRNVLGVALPSRFSSEGSLVDARDLAGRLDIRSITVPIEATHRAAEATLGAAFLEIGAVQAPGVTEENVQSRLRGLILMALSNKTGAILLTTGNKSELAVGYCTLYGDMNGGLAVLSDVTKMDVYRLARWINANHARRGFEAPPIPESSITKPPSAELRPDQTDQDTLPAYEVLDAIIERYVEGRRSISEIGRETGFDAGLVRRVVRMIDQSEYKRRQMPTGLKVTSITFGPGRRWPIAQRYIEG